MILKLVGGVILASVFISMFWATTAVAGWRLALLAWATSIITTAVIMLSLLLLFS